MSLLDQATPATPDTGSSTPPAAATPATPPAAAGEGTPPVINNNDWYYADNVKGEGAAPDWFKTDKYKSVTDQAKAYSEVEKKLGAFKGAPDEYDLSLKDYPELKFSQDDPMIQEFLASAKANGVSQEYLSEVLDTYAKAITANLPDEAAEMKKIGPNAQQDLQVLSQWAGQHLSKEEFGMFSRMLTTADAYHIFERLRQSMTQSDVPATTTTQHRETEEQVRQAMSDPRYETDPSYRAEIRRRMSMALAGGKGK